MLFESCGIAGGELCSASESSLHPRVPAHRVTVGFDVFPDPAQTGLPPSHPPRPVSVVSGIGGVQLNTSGKQNQANNATMSLNGGSSGVGGYVLISSGSNYNFAVGNNTYVTTEVEEVVEHLRKTLDEKCGENIYTRGNYKLKVSGREFELMLWNVCSLRDFEL
jgi:hypothetical protein